MPFDFKKEYREYYMPEINDIIPKLEIDLRLMSVSMMTQYTIVLRMIY